MSADGSTPIAGQAGAVPPSVTAIATELAAMHAQIEASMRSFDHVDAEYEHHRPMWDRVTSLEKALTRNRPLDGKEAVVAVAVALWKFRHVHEVADFWHTEGVHTLERVLEWAEANAGVTAAELGLSSYVAERGEGTVCTEEDTARTNQFLWDLGYLAAVHRFARLYLPAVQTRLDRAREAGVTDTADDLCFDAEGRWRKDEPAPATAAGVEHEAEPVEVRP